MWLMTQILTVLEARLKRKNQLNFPIVFECLNYDLIDIWRTRNSDRKLFSRKQKNPLVQRRLDFWLISGVCQDEVEETNIKTAIRTDHSAITISFNSLDEQTRSPSYWKFNSSLVDDENYVLAINQKIPEWLEEFKEVIDKRVLWDLIKYRVRQFTTDALCYTKKRHIREGKS